jgi:hypothetical protein
VKALKIIVLKEKILIIEYIAGKEELIIVRSLEINIIVKMLIILKGRNISKEMLMIE